MKFQSPRGTQDVLPVNTMKWQKLVDTTRSLLEFYSFKEIIIPIFEHTELFQRSVGESTDIVNKEMYTFFDKSQRSLTLRPEATVGIMRAYIENGLHRMPKPVKLWTHGPMFRYERAQTGRYRQFHQIDAEILGSSSVSPEIESIQLLHSLFTTLGINFKIEINSLGDEESRASFKQYFQKYSKGFLGDLCGDCKRRYEQNPLRMLDCKVQADQEIFAGAKKPADFLSEASEKRWEEIKTILGIYKEKSKREITNLITNPGLVRGLDYYNDFVFEIKSTSEKLKGQSTICAGGRYDRLVGSLGGPETPGFGWAIGIERVIADLDYFWDTISIMIIASDMDIYSIEHSIYEEAYNNKLKLNTERGSYQSNISKQIESAVKRNFDFILFYLDDEKKSNKFKFKNLKTNKQIEIDANMQSFFKNLKNEIEELTKLKKII